MSGTREENRRWQQRYRAIKKYEATPWLRHPDDPRQFSARFLIGKVVHEVHDRELAVAMARCLYE